MRRMSADLTRFSSAIFLLAAFATASGQQRGQVTKELSWSLPENEIESPSFSPDGSRIALVTRVHWPDGDEAESLPESFFNRLEKRKQHDPRFAYTTLRFFFAKIEVNERYRDFASTGLSVTNLKGSTPGLCARVSID
jgi:hypothetical protein